MITLNMTFKCQTPEVSMLKAIKTGVKLQNGSNLGTNGYFKFGKEYLKTPHNYAKFQCCCSNRCGRTQRVSGHMLNSIICSCSDEARS